MIRLIYGIPGAGKTALAVALGLEAMYGENATDALDIARAEADELNEKGFCVSPPSTEHLVYCDRVTIDVTSSDFGHRRSLKLYADRLGIATEGFTPQFIRRGGTLIIDELPEIADSRNWGSFSENMCIWWAKHRKHLLTIYGTCQDLDQVEKRIRKLARITHVLNMELVYNAFDEVVQTVWTLHNWDCYEHWEKGIEPSEETYVYNGDIREAYDTYEGEEDFYVGLEGNDFDDAYSGYADFTPQGIRNYAKNNPIKNKKGGA